MDQLRSVLSSYSRSVILRAMINDQDFVTGVEGLQGPAKPQGVVTGMQNRSERRHDSISKECTEEFGLSGSLGRPPEGLNVAVKEKRPAAAGLSFP